MSTKEIISKIKKLPLEKQFLVFEKIRETIQETKSSQIENAVEALHKNYKDDKELTEFTSLDFEDFYEAR